MIGDAIDKYPTKATAVARAYLACMERRDREGIVSLLADDTVMECVLAIDGTNERRRFWDSIEGARDHYTNAFGSVASIEFTEVEINQALDPAIVFVEALGSMTMADGKPYNNRYVFKFELRDGKVAMLTEYCNPVTAAISFGYADAALVANGDPPTVADNRRKAGERCRVS